MADPRSGHRRFDLLLDCVGEHLRIGKKIAKAVGRNDFLRRGGRHRLHGEMDHECGHLVRRLGFSEFARVRHLHDRRKSEAEGELILRDDCELAQSDGACARPDLADVHSAEGIEEGVTAWREFLFEAAIAIQQAHVGG